MPGRRSRRRTGFQNIESAWALLIDILNDIELLQRLTKRHNQRIEKVKADEKTTRSGASLKQHKFLKRVSAINPDFHKLCVVAFSQNQISFTKNAILDGLVEKIRGQRDGTIISPTTRSLLHRSEDDIRPIPLPQETIELPKAPSEPWVELRYTKREGIEKVFRQYLLDRIENTDLRQNWRAVFMRLPMWPQDLSGPYFMLLNLREGSVKEVAMALFKVEVTWRTNAFWIIHENGLLQIIPHSQYTMKGVSDKDIIAVFGADIHAAITTYSIRANELREGDRRTKCVSITFLEKRAVINLILSVSEGVKIQSKLSVSAKLG
ncbi:hypothetical protein COCCADRAFT_113512 [Bipolaris zeicola 26-R-13]|uniref:Uncharacterized protein n=1 Tax=Cochliobolus carbonum (strain 26-R-13) TaxID=930089 RepID=W6XMH9_COCC2|nr:uncharacterized protein COCCADRAFT_113512 [Bipolaris zeicola 26-R-13]EUC26738.1 hypothetical protein COCCADRAFT_113512 [Bipolaris zeicola 26-R-13]